MEDYIFTEDFKEMYTKIYWKQIFSLETSLEVKWIAIKSLWYLRRIKGDYNG